MSRAGGLFLVVVLAAAAFAARTVLVLVMRRRWPSAAGAVERWWPWVPLVAVCVFLVWITPVIGIVVTIGVVIGLTRADALGSPFRPRR